MNKTWKDLVLLVFLGSIAIILFNFNKYLLDEREQLMKKFDDNNVLDMNGNVNLTELEIQRDNLEKTITKLFSDNNIDIDKYEDDIREISNKNDDLVLQLQELNKKKESLSSKKDSLISEYTVLNNKYQLVLREREEEIRRNTIMIDGVPTIYQYPNYPTGCESVTLTILLKYYGVNVSVDEVISSLSKGDYPYDDNGVKYGGNPEIEFIGSPYSDNSYGVYNNPIGDVANMYRSGVTVKTGMPFSDVLELVKENRPVIVWTSMNLAVPYISNSWIYKPTGATINWKAQEHAVVIIGYNDDNVIISDPLRGAIRYQSRYTFESRYNYYGKRAVYY